LINELAHGALGQFVNLFSPSMKPDRKEIDEGGKERRFYGEPAAPFARVMAHPEILPEKKAQLQELKSQINPFALEASIQKQLRKIAGLRRALE